jgi:hypothetical protein
MLCLSLSPLHFSLSPSLTKLSRKGVQLEVRFCTGGSEEKTFMCNIWTASFCVEIRCQETTGENGECYWVRNVEVKVCTITIALQLSVIKKLLTEVPINPIIRSRTRCFRHTCPPTHNYTYAFFLIYYVVYSSLGIVYEFNLLKCITAFLTDECTLWTYLCTREVLGQK